MRVLAGGGGESSPPIWVDWSADAEQLTAAGELGLTVAVGQQATVPDAHEAARHGHALYAKRTTPSPDREGKRRLLVSLPTGTGKILIFAHFPH